MEGTSSISGVPCGTHEYARSTVAITSRDSFRLARGRSLPCTLHLAFSLQHAPQPRRYRAFKARSAGLQSLECHDRAVQFVALAPHLPDCLDQHEITPARRGSISSSLR